MVSAADPPGAPPPPSRRPHGGRWWLSRWFVGFVALVLGIIIGGATSSGNGDTTASPTPTPSPVTLTQTQTVTVTTTAPAPTPKQRARPSKAPATASKAPATPPPTLRTPPRTVHVAGIPAADLPVARLTPGSVLTTSAAVVCVSGYSASVRDVPDSEKEAVYARYDIPHVPYAHEVDHLISLELGGSNAIVNLWPEPYAGRWGARTKDVLENKLHDLVCAGTLTLPYAQRIERTNWVAAYRRYVGAPTAPAPPAPNSPAPPATHAPPAGNCEPGYSPCLPVVGDLNCSDLSADQTPVRVTGADRYGLDADGDGYGCES